MPAGITRRCSVTLRGCSGKCDSGANAVKKASGRRWAPGRGSANMWTNRESVGFNENTVYKMIRLCSRPSECAWVTSRRAINGTFLGLNLRDRNQAPASALG